MQSEWLSNAYVVAEAEGGDALIVDSGMPLHDAIEQLRVRPRYLLRTHSHHDHVAHEDELVDRYGLTVVAEPGELELGGLRVRGLATPGHSDDMVAFVINDEVVFTGDTLFKDAVGGGNLDQVRSSVMDVLMQLPHEARVLPGHTDETTLAREWEQNPFVRVWRGAEPEGTEPVTVNGEDATLIVWSPDYDGNGKAWVRFADGRDAIVGGSRVERR
jgi:glyoxylase-like metal-dependent hydrolase (beta-lactamase superfamily II)